MNGYLYYMNTLLYFDIVMLNSDLSELFVDRDGKNLQSDLKTLRDFILSDFETLRDFILLTLKDKQDLGLPVFGTKSRSYKTNVDMIKLRLKSIEKLISDLSAYQKIDDRLISDLRTYRDSIQKILKNYDDNIPFISRFGYPQKQQLRDIISETKELHAKFTEYHKHSIPSISYFNAALVAAVASVIRHLFSR